MRARECHREVLALIGDAAPPAHLAYHAERCAERDRAVELHHQAGEEAARHNAHRQAFEHWTRAIDLVDGGAAGDLRALLRLASRAAALSLGDAAAAGLARRLVGLGDPEPVCAAEDRCWLSRVVTSSSESAALIRAVLDSLPVAGAERVRALALALEATELMLERRLRESELRAGEALANAELVGDTESTVMALQAHGCARLLQGEADGAADLERAIDLANTAGLLRECARGHINLVSAAGEACRYDVVAASAGPALEFVTEHDADIPAAYLRAWLARCAFEQGRWPEATSWIDQVLDPRSGSLIANVLALSLQGRLRARRGDPRIWPPLDEAYALAQDTELLQRVAPVVAARAEARWLNGTVDDGTDGLDTTYELARRLNHTWAIGELGFWLRRHGRLDRIDPRAATPYLLQAQGDIEGAARHWENLGRPYDAADVRSDSDDPAEVLSAHATFVSLGARPAASRAARRLRELGQRSIPRGPSQPARAHPQGLTRREEEIAQLVRRGYTDRDIAARLHLSARTVSHHVSAVLRKLDLNSRRQLSAETPRYEPGTGEAPRPHHP
jgi:DNA-binding CsgD family transcriptional regulator